MQNTTDTIFALIMLMENYRGQKALHCVFIDLENPYDRVPREKLRLCMKEPRVEERYVRLVQDMNESSKTVVRWAV